MTVVVRRRGWLMGLVAVASMLVAGGYLWRFGDTGSGVQLALGVGLGLLAVCFGYAWRDARTPLLLADATGLRVRLGSAWAGVPWSQVERVEVDGRRRVRDGHVALLVSSDAPMLAEVGRRARFAAVVNRWLYDASLVVPFGLTTSVSTGDLVDALARLSDGRAPVVDLDVAVEEPEPTVEITGPAGASESSELDEPGHLEGAAGAVDAPDLEDAPEAGDGIPVQSASTEWDGPALPRQPEPVGGGRPSFAELLVRAGEHQHVESDGVPGAEPTGIPARLVAARDAVPAPLSKVVSALRSKPARREEVTIPGRREHATMGGLALSQPIADRAQALPEVTELRRRDSDETPSAEPGRGNIGLIIDATTDLSARAMSKVRRPAPSTDGSPDPGREAERPASGEDAAGWAVGAEPLLIGSTIREAREHVMLTVDDLADRTRIRPSVIEAIEVDDFVPCGGDFYARGHLRMLARVLGIDAEPLITTYDDHFAASPINARQVFDVELASGTGGVMRGATAGTNWGGLIAAVLVLVLIWGVARFVAGGADPDADKGRSTQNSSGLGSPGVGNKPAPPVIIKTAHVTVSAVGGNSVVRVLDGSGEVVFRGLVVDGTSRKFSGEPPLTVRALDGGVVTLTRQGKAISGDGGESAVMGEPGIPARQRVNAH